MRERWPSEQAPQVVPLGLQFGLEDRLMTFSLAAGDADGDALAWSATNLPVGATFNTGSATFVWTPGFEQAGTYTVFLGGSLLGERLNAVYKDYVPFDQIITELRPLFARFKEERTPGERFGDFCHRAGIATAEEETVTAEPVAANA